MKGSLKPNESGTGYLFTDSETKEVYFMPSEEVSYKANIGAGNLALILESCEAVDIGDGKVSHAKVQRDYINSFKDKLGTIIEGKVKFTNEYSAFIEMENHVLGKLPMNYVCTAHLPDIRVVIRAGMTIKAIVRSVSKEGVQLSTKELFGTFEENAASTTPNSLFQNRPIIGLSHKCIFVLLQPNFVGAIPLPADPTMEIGQTLNCVIGDDCDTKYRTAICYYTKMSEVQYPISHYQYPNVPISYFIRDDFDYMNWRYSNHEDA